MARKDSSRSGCEVITAAAVYEARIAMGRRFSHAAKARRTTESVLLSVDLGATRGWGEGAPRSYVTGETLVSAVAALRCLDVAMLGDLLDWRSFESAVASLAALELPRMLAGGVVASAPAAATALEIALLDAVCRLHGRPLADALRAAGVPSRCLRTRPRAATASLVVDLSRDPAALLDAMDTHGRAALRHVKVKGTHDAATTLDRLAQVRERIGTRPALSLDLNGAWTPDRAVAAAAQLRALDVDWIEEPTAPRDWSGLRRIRAAGLGVMLDESFVDVADLELAAAAHAATHVNVRVSKCGGVLRSAMLAARARTLGIGFQLGVHVGEVGPLWAAGRMLATTLRGAATVEAGRQDEWFAQPLTTPPFSAVRSRQLVAALDGPGTGVEPSPVLLRQLRTRAVWERGASEWRPAA